MHLPDLQHLGNFQHLHEILHTFLMERLQHFMFLYSVYSLHLCYLNID